MNGIPEDCKRDTEVLTDKILDLLNVYLKEHKPEAVGLALNRAYSVFILSYFEKSDIEDMAKSSSNALFQTIMTLKKCMKEK